MELPAFRIDKGSLRWKELEVRCERRNLECNDGGDENSLVDNREIRQVGSNGMDTGIGVAGITRRRPAGTVAVEWASRFTDRFDNGGFDSALAGEVRIAPHDLLDRIRLHPQLDSPAWRPL